VEIFIFWAQTLLEGVEKEYLSCVLKFRTFGNTSQKLWPNMLLFFCKWVVWAEKKSLSSKIKINFFFFRFIYMCKTLNHSILINEMKVTRSFYLWIVMDSLF